MPRPAPRGRSPAPAALDLFRLPGHRHGQSEALTHLAIAQRLTGDYGAAVSLRLAQELNRDLGDRYKQAWTLSDSR